MRRKLSTGELTTLEASVILAAFGLVIWGLLLVVKHTVLHAAS